jgi:hypothetical protein
MVVDPRCGAIENTLTCCIVALKLRRNRVLNTVKPANSGQKKSAQTNSNTNID